MKKLKKYFDANIAIFTNQSGFSKGKYHFEVLKEFANLKAIFLPEHGLFAELQDQVSGSNLKYNYENTKIINLYGDDENSLFVKEEDLFGIEVIIFDIQDVGARYYTFLTSCLYIMQSVSKFNKQNSKRIEILIFESKNPIGRKIEGSALFKEFSSFVGVESIPHRHGLNIHELMNYYNDFFQLNLKINSLLFKDFNETYWIPPSPNIPSKETCKVYVGQCLLEGTNLSEGRGTTRPFEIFGAPFINIQNSKLLKELNLYQKDNFYLRPLFFIPTFHKYKDQICGGFQLIPLNNKFHSLLFSLFFIRTINEYYPNNFEFLKGVYEFRSDKPAIELLAGDKKILSYLNGEIHYLELKEYFEDCEIRWKKKIKQYISE